VADDIVEPIITKQVAVLSAHGPGTAEKDFADRKTSQPLTILPLESLSSRLRNGYEIIFAFFEGKDMNVQVGSREVKTRNVGFLLKRA
jgi:hypothetical protein